MMFLRKLFNAPTYSQERPGQTRTWLTPKQAGVRVDHDSALTFSAVFRAISYISSQIAGLPFDIYRNQPDGGRRRIDSNIRYLLHTRPNPEMSAFTFRETMTAWALSWGNGYAEIEIGLGGEPVALWPIPPDRVELLRAPDGTLVYEISGKGEKTYLPADRVFHLHGLGFDGLVGYSVIALAARSIGIGMATEEFGASFFGNGSTLGGVLTIPGQLSEQAYQRLKEDWNKKHVGPQSAHKPAILEDGMKWEAMGIPPGDAQFLETRKFQISDIARWYGVPPHKLGDLERATFSNIEHQNIEVVVDTMMPWAIRWEQEVDFKLLNRRGRLQLFSKLKLNALMRGDAKSRAEFYREMSHLGVLSVNEIRTFEDLNPIGDVGDKRMVQLNMTTLEKIGEDEPQAADEMDENPIIDSQKLIISDALQRITRRERSSMSAKNYYDPDYHRKYIQRDIDAPVRAALMTLDYPVNLADSIIANYTDYHLNDSADIIANGGEIATDQRVLDNTELLISFITDSSKANS